MLKELLFNIYSELSTRELLDSVQVVVIDGNSSDTTSQVAQEFLGKFRLKYFKRDKREGIDRDILKCIELSDGAYCWLFSDDDRFTPGAINHLLNILKREKDLTGCFCNRTPYDALMEKKVAEISGWPGRFIKNDLAFTDKSDFFKSIGMDFGFISSQVVKKSVWQEVVQTEDFRELDGTLYLMAHIISRMMDRDFKWLFLSRPMLKQRTGNDSFLNEGIMKRQQIEHNSFQLILDRHYAPESAERKAFFRKMVHRLPRALANLKSQQIGYGLQFHLLKLYYLRYKSYPAFWLKVIPIFLIPNLTFEIVKKVYFKYMVRS